MNQMIQSLENRVLMSATADALALDVAAVTSATVQAKAALGYLHAAEASLHLTVVAGVKATQTKGQRAANLRLNAALNKADAIAAAKITSAESALIAVSKSGSKSGLSVAKAVLAHPTKTSLQKALTKAIASLGTVVAAKEQVLSTAVTNTLAGINAVYSNVAIEDPSVAADITTGEAGVATATSAFTTAFSGIGAAIEQLAVDLNTV